MSALAVFAALVGSGALLGVYVARTVALRRELREIKLEMERTAHEFQQRSGEPAIVGDTIRWEAHVMRRWIRRRHPVIRVRARPLPRLGVGFELVGRLLPPDLRAAYSDEWLDHIRLAHAAGHRLIRVRLSLFLRAVLPLAVVTRFRAAKRRAASWW